MNCLYSGRKRLAFWHPKHKAAIESEAMGWFRQDDAQPGDRRYGEFFEVSRRRRGRGAGRSVVARADR